VVSGVSASLFFLQALITTAEATNAATDKAKAFCFHKFFFIMFCFPFRQNYMSYVSGN